jgi:polysaccharide export outer membrane protein
MLLASKLHVTFEVRKILRWPGVALAAFALVQAAAPIAAAQQSPAAASKAYHLGAGDRLHVTVYNEPAFSGDFSVSDSGGISLPLAGEIKASGLTVIEFQQLATKVLADGYINDPKVSVEILSYRPFYILGEVNKPGEYPFAPGMTVFNAVASASGFTYRSNKTTILIKHEGELEEREVRLDATAMVQPGDTIRIKERHF